MYFERFCISRVEIVEKIWQDVDCTLKCIYFHLALLHPQHYNLILQNIRIDVEVIDGVDIIGQRWDNMARDNFILSFNIRYLLTIYHPCALLHGYINTRKGLINTSVCMFQIYSLLD